MYTLLEMVNSCLRAIGQEPVNDLEFQDSDVTLALSAITEANREVQSRGWWFNEENAWELGIGSDGNIYVPAIVGGLRAYQNDHKELLSIRGRRVWDNKRHTYDLTAASGEDRKISFDFTLVLDPEDIPLTAQQLVKQMAVVQMVTDLDADQIKITENKSKLTPLLALLEREDLKARKLNGYGSARVQAVLSPFGIVGGGFGNPLGGHE